MKVFISWSGKRSKETAEVLCKWIRQILQAAEPWISLDIEKGSRWNEKISQELEQTKIGIICLNQDNISSEWILFEAGALSKTKDAHVCTFLLDINPAEIKPPLGQFQHTLFKKDDMKKLIFDINNKMFENGEKKLLEGDLEETFETFWPKLNSNLEKIQKTIRNSKPVQRSDREILEEILQVVRTIPQSQPSFLSGNSALIYLKDLMSKETEKKDKRKGALELTVMYVEDPKTKKVTASFVQFPNIVSEGINIEDATKNLWKTAQTVFEVQRREEEEKLKFELENQDVRIRQFEFSTA